MSSVESTFPQWSINLFERLQALFPNPSDFEPLPDDALPAPSVSMEQPPADQCEAARSDAIIQTSVESEGLSWAPDCRWAKLVKNERVTRADWWQDVREVEIEIEEKEDSRCQAL